MKKIITLIILGMALNSCAQKVIINREIDTPEYGKMLLGSQSLDQFQKEPYKAGMTKITPSILSIKPL